MSRVTDWKNELADRIGFFKLGQTVWAVASIVLLFGCFALFEAYSHPEHKAGALLWAKGFGATALGTGALGVIIVCVGLRIDAARKLERIAENTALLGSSFSQGGKVIDVRRRMYRICGRHAYTDYIRTTVLVESVSRPGERMFVGVTDGESVGAGDCWSFELDTNGFVKLATLLSSATRPV